MTVKAIYKQGLFKPVTPVNLPENAEVEIVLPDEKEDFARHERTRKEIIAILSRSYETGESDLAERHNEHQP